MVTHHRLDRESFDALLADAFAVQQSGLDRQSLTSLVEIQQFIASDEFDFDEEMRVVADRVLKLSKASGVAIALLHANQLVYCARVGTATKQIGSRVAAVLNVSSSGNLRQEILRVEDAAKDTRIGADICRQFGARSLLMLPIYENGALKGILQVLFDDAHSFLEPEIRLYRLMASALEQGISRRQRKVEKHEPIGTTPQACEVEVDSDRELHFKREIVTSSIRPSRVEPNTFQPHGPTNTRNHFAMEQSKESQVSLGIATRHGSHPLVTLKAAVASTVDSRNTDSWWFSAASATAIGLGIMIWLSSGNRPIPSTGRSIALALRENHEPANSKPSSAKQKLNLPGNIKEKTRGVPEFKRVRISPDEVDDIAEDVTIRRFATRATQPQLQGVVKEVSFGDDVTIRYFANGAPAVFKPTNLGSVRNQKLQQP